MHACDLAALHYMQYRVDGGAQHLQLGVLLKLVSGQSSAKGRPPKTSSIWLVAKCYVNRPPRPDGLLETGGRRSGLNLINLMFSKMWLY